MAHLHLNYCLFDLASLMIVAKAKSEQELTHFRVFSGLLSIDLIWVILPLTKQLSHCTNKEWGISDLEMAAVSTAIAVIV